MLFSAEIWASGSAFHETSNFDDICISRILYFVQSVGLLYAWAERLHKRPIMIKVYGSPWYPPLCILFHCL